MLRYMRKNVKSWIVKLAFFVIILVFSFWGVGSMTAKKRNVVATVNGSAIIAKDFSAAYDRLLQRYQQQYKDQFSSEMAAQLKLKQQALNSMIDRQLMLDYGRKFKLDVSDEELQASIAGMAAFQNNGSFDPQLYRQLLRYNHLTPADFEISLRDDLLLDKLRKLFSSGAKVTSQEVGQLYRQQKEKISLDMVKLDPQNYSSSIKVSDKDLPEYFAAHEEDFRVPEKRDIVAVKVDSHEVEKKIVISDKYVATYYEDHLGDYVVPEQVKASHILFKVNQDDPEPAWDEAKTKAQEIIAKLKQGQDFPALAKQYSQGPSASRGGELGLFGRGAMVKSFEDAAFDLSVGTFTQTPVRTRFGYHVIKVDEHKSAYTKGLDEVKKDIRAQLVQERLPQLVKQAIDQVAVHLNDVTPETFMEKAATLSDPVLETGFFAQKESIKGIGTDRVLADKVFSTPVGTMARVENPQQNSYLFMVKEIQKSYLPKFKQVAEEVKKVYQLEQAQAKVKRLAVAMLTEAKEKKNLDDVAAIHKLKIDYTGLFSRGSGYVPKIGMDKQLSAKVFALDSEHPLYPQPLEYQGITYLVQLKEKILEEKNKDNVAADKEQIYSQLQRYKEYQELNGLRNRLRQVAEIKIMPGVLEE
ncbi:MAG: SurA N-terminal domain-containing protein [Pseudomonadota bacterium]|nr:SurA N-terminal domain-containing protein [Pseudomonadota bacterium]